MSRFVIENGTVFTGCDLLRNASVVVDGTDVVELGPGRPELRSDDRRIDAAGRLVTPGLVNGHTHIYSALARGLPLKDPPPGNFVEILERIWWRLDRALTMEAIQLSAKLHGIECLKAGVTTLFDHHASQALIPGTLSILSDSLLELGLRACLCFEVSDREGSRAAQDGIKENVRFLEETERSGAAMRRALFGLHAPFTLSDETLAACADAVKGRSVGFHVHLAEDSAEDPDAVERLERFGMLGRQTLAVHGVHLDPKGIERLRDTGTWLVHCPESNLHNAVGTVSVEKLLDAGLCVVLGTDGFTARIVREALVAHLMQSDRARDPRIGYETIPGLLWSANAKLASQTFGIELGVIEPAAPADLVIWDYDPPTPLTAENLWGHLLFGLVDRQAAEVWIAGKHRLTEGCVIGSDEREIMRRCRHAAEKLWERF